MLALSLLWVGCTPAGAPLHAREGMRDFPPLVDPDRPAIGSAPAQTEQGPTTPAEVLGALPSQTFGSSDEPYRLGVGDELSVVTLGQVDYSRAVKVLPDGTISAPGSGTVYVLGRTVDEAAAELQDRLATYLKYPQVNLIVTGYGEHVIYVMGEVTAPADHPYRKGMSALQAVAAAGGFRSSAQRKEVVVFRRVGPDVAEFYQIDLGTPLEGESFTNDMVLRPYDIVFVPKNLIGNVNTFVDQWFRQNLSALTFYLQGWDAYSVTKDRVVITRELR